MKSEFINNSIVPILAAAASNPEAPKAVLDALSDLHSESIEIKLAKNKSTSIEVLEKLHSEGSEEVRIALAQNEAIEPLMWKLANDDNPSVRFALAHNMNMPEHLHEALCTDEDPSVRRRARRSLRLMRQSDSIIATAIQLFKKKQAA